MKIVLSKSRNPCADIERLLIKLKSYDKSSLILISLDPAATLLTYELNILGYQKLDIGHITSCYDKVFYNDVQSEKLPLVHD